MRLSSHSLKSGREKKKQNKKKTVMDQFVNVSNGGLFQFQVWN